jgi:hypothetical protein
LLLAIPVISELTTLILAVVRLPYFVSKGVNLKNLKNAVGFEGFNPVGDLLFKVGGIYFLGLIGYTLLFYSDSVMRILVFIMWPLGLISFSAPLCYVHKFMKDHKTELLTNIRSRLHEEGIMDITYGETKDYDSLKMLTLLIISNDIEKMSEYPFDISSSLFNFLSTAIISIVLPLVLPLIL